MEGKDNISQYRERLDRTLASNDLVNEEALKTLVKNQILCSSQCETEEFIDNLVEIRTKEVARFVDMLRSASENDEEILKLSQAPHGGWKLKQDTQELRVMYREGPVGCPFHTLLAEGYVDGPVDVCLCISCESSLYQKWWPHVTVPTFKITSSQCLQRIRIGEQICLVRMKVSWPLSEREALIHYFVFEYFQDDLIVVLLNSISNLDNNELSSRGFARDGIPDAGDIVRIDVVGGFAIQKVSTDRSYFRTIANMDIKLDFVPPAFINFVSRQLIGSGFKLYKKEVASATKGDSEFCKALKDPLYIRVRKALYFDKISKGSPEQKDLKGILPGHQVIETVKVEEVDMDDKVVVESEDLNSNIWTQPGENPSQNMGANGKSMDKELLNYDNLSRPATEDAEIPYYNVGEIEEVERRESKESKNLEEYSKELYYPSVNQISGTHHINCKKEVIISSEVNQALKTLERAISLYQNYRFSPESRSLPVLTSIRSSNVEKDTANESKPSENGQICSNGRHTVESLKTDSAERIAHEARNSSGSHGSRCSVLREANHKKVAPTASPDEDILKPRETDNETAGATILKKSKSTDSDGQLAIDDSDEMSRNSLAKRKSKKLRFCCFHFLPEQLMA